MVATKAVKKGEGGKKMEEKKGRVLKNIKSICISASILSSISGISSVQASNWLMLQGTEPVKAKKHRFWGFVQPQYTYNEAPELKNLRGAAAGNNGKTVAANLVGPQLDSSDKLQFRRARVGARGKVTDDIHYFSLIEAAPNALTYEPFGERHRAVALSDLSLTFNYIKRSAEATEDYSAISGFPAPKAAGTTYNVNEIVDNLDDRYALQLTWIF